MTPDEVRKRVDEIVARGDRDPELNHIDADALVIEVLAAIADGGDDAQGLARELLRLVGDEERTRWCA